MTFSVTKWTDHLFDQFPKYRVKIILESFYCKIWGPQILKLKIAHEILHTK